MTYPQRVREAILPLSVGKKLPEAFEEWSFTDDIVDHGKPIVQCELCGQEDLRYQFEIRNSLTNNFLWVGSQCILKFNLSVFEDGRKLSEEDAKKKLNRLIEKMKLDACIKALSELAIKDGDSILVNALGFYRKNKYLTPKYAFVVFWKLSRSKIDYSPSFFSINLSRSSYKKDLKDMPSERLHFLWKSLTSSQRKIAIRLGHKDPFA